LLQAGLVPSLEDFQFQVLPTVRFARVGLEQSTGESSTPRANPFTELVYDTVLPEGTLPSPRQDLEALATHLRAEYGGTSTLLILDQFEELFVNRALWRERGEFLAQLRVILEKNHWLRAVLAIRSDYLADLIPHERDLPSRMLVRYGLESLKEKPASEAIKQAFTKSGVSITSEELTLLLDRLLSIETGMLGSRVRGQHVNLIQLQIVCRRLWEEKARAVRLRDAGTADGPELLRSSAIDLADSMRSFVDSAVAGAVTQTHADEGVVRRWLEDRLITPTTGRRAILLVDNEKTMGLPDEILDALEDVRLVQVEQRNQSRYAELTHDSMVTAVRASNATWVKTRRRARRRLSAGLLVALVGLLVLFAILRDPPEELLLTETDGFNTGGSTRIEFPRPPDGRIAVVQVRVLGIPTGGVTIRVVRDENERQDVELGRQTVTSSDGGEARTTVELVVDTTPLGSYALVMDNPGDAVLGYSGFGYSVAVHSVPVVFDRGSIGNSAPVEISSPLSAIKLDAGQPVHLRLGFGAEFQDILGAEILYRDSDVAVIESPNRAAYAVIRITGTYGEDVATNLDAAFSLKVPSLRFGANKIRRMDTAISSIQVGEDQAPFSIQGDCQEDAGLNVVRDGRSVLPTDESSPSSVGADLSALTPVADAGSYRVVLTTTTYSGAPLDCSVRLRPLAKPRIGKSGTGKVAVGAGSLSNSYAVQLPTDSIVVVNRLDDAVASLDCPPGTVESESERLVAFAARNRKCVLTITLDEPLEQPVSFPLQVVPTTRG
jgi:hypothetical protein